MTKQEATKIFRMVKEHGLLMHNAGLSNKGDIRDLEDAYRLIDKIKELLME